MKNILLSFFLLLEITFSFGQTGTVTSVGALNIGTAGTNVNSTVTNSTTTPVITLNIPYASQGATGLVTTGNQVFSGQKTFTSGFFLDPAALNTRTESC
ncbi:hypothetical protein [Flavobacterium ginsengiterrae]|uniref:Uncharacterized protein n=1 Tax=Flavobacterium ginsengiterrae TaxID=871695 RepID=A0ABP7GNZ5_9FLAO